ncbi:MAG: MBL fold metallo-hydrolase [Vulcanimicrobiaceae bacterium]
MVAPGRIALVRAPNPSAMTLSGTNSYLIDCGNGQSICIDPGPALPAHIEAIASHAANRGLKIGLILLTHGHPDHAPGAALLRAQTGAPIAAHAGNATSHDRDLLDGETLVLGESSVRVVEAPGHTFDHLVFYEPREAALFTGDVVLGEGTVVIAPPGGAMRAYQATLSRLAAEFSGARVIYGGHGQPVTDPAAKLHEYIEHRRSRERELLAALAEGPKTIPDLVTSIYAEISPVLWPAAARQMLAYLVALLSEKRVRAVAVHRRMTPAERALLNPAWENLVSAGDAGVAEAELGTSWRIDTLESYELIS